MTRFFYLLFGVAAYAVFLGTFLYLIAFVGGIPVVPTTVDTGGAPGPAGTAAAIDAALILLFAVQHSVMARPGFKAAWTRIVPAPVERSTYVLFASMVLILTFALWRPIPAIVWAVGNPVGVAALWTVFGLGWAIALTSTYLLNHFELFGLQQVWLNLRRRAAQDGKFRQPLFYKLVRHPLYTGFVIAYWATPVMTAGHLLLAGGMTAFILVAIQLEERDLVAVFGDAYRNYRARTGMLVPKLRRR